MQKCFKAHGNWLSLLPSLICLKIPHILINSCFLRVDRHKRSEDTTSIKTTMEKCMTERKRFIRLPEVLKRTGLCKAWIYKLISQDRFPEPIKLGERAIAFVESEIDEWIDQMIDLSRNKSA